MGEVQRKTKPIARTIGEYVIAIYRPYWDHDSVITVRCVLGYFKAEGFDRNYAFFDIRKTRREALWLTIQHIFPEFISDPKHRNAKTQLFHWLKLKYKELRKTWNTQWLPRIKLPHPMKFHQKDALFDTMYQMSWFLAFEMGLGKSITAVACSMLLGAQRTIVISPQSAKWNWYLDLTTKWDLNPLLMTILDANVRDTTKGGIDERFVFVNYDVLPKYMEHLISRPTQHIIIDEASDIKNEKTRRAKAVNFLLTKFPQAKVTYLSGTPITNRVNDLYNYLRLSQHPLALLGEDAFVHRYALRENKKIVGVQNAQELNVRLSNWMVRKTTEECEDLPPITMTLEYTDMADIQEEYDAAMEEVYEKSIIYKELKRKSEEDPWDKELKRELAKQKTSTSSSIFTLNRVLATAKIGVTKTKIDSILNEDKKVVNFCGYTVPLESVHEHYNGDSVIINGKVTGKKRLTAIDSFQNGDKRVLCGNIQAAGMGITVTAAHHAIFMNVPLVPKDLEQPMKRIHRIGQEHPCWVTFLIVRNSIDERLFELVVSKQQDIISILDPSKDLQLDLSKATTDITEEIMKEVINEVQRKRVTESV